MEMKLFTLELLFLATFTFAVIFFSDPEFLPYKRKMENMLQTIKRYQDNLKTSEVNLAYKGKTFKIHVKYVEVNYYYGYYEVSINNNLVKTFHILEHLFSKSRYEEHHGDMRESEEYEIIKEVYKQIKQINKERFDKKWDESSYFK